MSHSVSRIRPGSPLQSKSNNSVFLFALHMHFPNIHIWTISFDLFFCFSIRGVCCCSHSLQAGEGVFWNCHCWGRPCYKSHGLHEFYHNETHRLWLSMPAFLSSSRLSGAFSGSRPADRAGSVAGMTSSAHHTAAEASCVPHVPNNSFLGNLFVHTRTVNQRSAFLSCRGVLLCGKCLSVRFVFHC